MTRRRLAALAAALITAAGITAVSAGPARASTCTISLGGTCGPYADATHFPPSNGFNTYVDDQSVGPNTGTTESVTATDATSWTATSDAVPLGSTNVQTFPSTQQQFNDWNGTG